MEEKSYKVVNTLERHLDRDPERSIFNVQPQQFEREPEKPDVVYGVDDPTLRLPQPLRDWPLRKRPEIDSLVPPDAKPAPQPDPASAYNVVKDNVNAQIHRVRRRKTLARQLLKPDVVLDAANEALVRKLEYEWLDVQPGTWVCATLVAHLGNGNDEIAWQAAHVLAALLVRRADLDNHLRHRFVTWLWNNRQDAEASAPTPYTLLTKAMKAVAGDAGYIGSEMPPSLDDSARLARVASHIVQGMCDWSDVEQLRNIRNDANKDWIDEFIDHAIVACVACPRTMSANRALAELNSQFALQFDTNENEREGS